MSHYASEIKPATTYIHRADFDNLLDDIKNEVKKDCWNCYGWRENVLKAGNIVDFLDEFGIKICQVSPTPYFRPIIEDVYVSNFFSKLIELAAPYMTNGKIVVDDEYEIVKIKFKDGIIK